MKQSEAAADRGGALHRSGSRVLLPLAFLLLLGACRNVFTSPPPPAVTVLAADALLPSPRLIVGRIVAVNEAQRFAFIELAADAPAAALIAGTGLTARTIDLRDTGKIEVSPYLRGRTLGAKIVAGQPSPGDEVVWLAP